MERQKTSLTSTEFAAKAYTFDDVLLVPAYSSVLPRQTDITTRLTRTISLNIPVASAAMDTVTESAMAIAMARQGGIGILHKNMSIERQAAEVRRVKRSDSGLILDPITLPPTATVTDVLTIMHNNSIGGIPVVDESNKLIGIVTNRDLRFERDYGRSLKDVMTSKPLVTAPKNTNLKQAEAILQKHKIEKLPLVDDAGHLVGLITYKDILKVENYPNAAKDNYGRLRVGAAIGITADINDRIAALKDAGVDTVVIDSAHGHAKGVLNAVSDVKKEFSDVDIIGGNVATAEGCKMLIDAGADAVKVGVGPGSICTTRVIAGIGVPQLSAIMSAAETARNAEVPIIADGGIRYTGDVVKAIAAGADTIMAGSMFAGTEESPGQTVILEGRKFKIYRGMGSLDAMEAGSKDRYFQDVEDDIKKLVPEGIVGRVPYKGNIDEVITQIIGGLRAGMGYCGAKNINALKKAKFVSISQAGMSESHPHNIIITKEAPNYSR